MPSDFKDDIEEHKLKCAAAGCLADLATKDDIEKVHSRINGIYRLFVTALSSALLCALGYVAVMMRLK
jgi:hypothetical protein